LKTGRRGALPGRTAQCVPPFSAAGAGHSKAVRASPGGTKALFNEKGEVEWEVPNRFNGATAARLLGRE